MSLTANNVIRNMRHMAWERAKGELHSMTHTFWNNKDNDKYNILRKVIETFIKEVEDNGLHE